MYSADAVVVAVVAVVLSLFLCLFLSSICNIFIYVSARAVARFVISYSIGRMNQNSMDFIIDYFPINYDYLLK